MALKSPALTAATGTLAAGVFTPSAGLAGYRSFDAVMSAGDTVDVVVRDSAGTQALYAGSAWDGSTLTLGTESVPSGTLVDGDVTVWAVGSTTAGRGLATAVDAAAQRALLGAVTSVEAAAAAPVQSVAGRTGAVTIASADITDSTATGRSVLTSATVAAAQQAIDVEVGVDVLAYSASTGTGDLVRASSPTLVTPALGTPSSGTLTNCSGLPASGISDSTSTGRAVLTAATAAAAQQAIDVEVGVDVLAFSAFDGLSRLVVLTEAEYAALSPPVAGTVYLTTPNP